MAFSSCEIFQCMIFGLLLTSSIFALGETPVNATNSSVTFPSGKPVKKTSEHVAVDLSKVVEGGTIDVVSKKNSSINDTTHTGHDRTPDNISSTKTISGVVSSSTAVPSVDKSAPIVPAVQPDVDLPPFDVPEKNDDKLSKPRKGATLDIPINITSNATTTSSSNNKTIINTKPSVGNISVTTTTTTEKPHKPIYTEAVDEDPNSQIKTSQSKEPQVPSIEYVTDNDKRNHKKADYIVPIVAVILSVPLVAIVISVLYKRGAEWWQHRHYRRMDFLIDGMYNN